MFRNGLSRSSRGSCCDGSWEGQHRGADVELPQGSRIYPWIAVQYPRCMILKIQTRSDSFITNSWRMAREMCVAEKLFTSFWIVWYGLLRFLKLIPGPLSKLYDNTSVTMITLQMMFVTRKGREEGQLHCADNIQCRMFNPALELRTNASLVEGCWRGELRVQQQATLSGGAEFVTAIIS